MQPPQLLVESRGLLCADTRCLQAPGYELRLGQLAELDSAQVYSQDLGVYWGSTGLWLC
jgi:hypothetical protein